MAKYIKPLITIIMIVMVFQMPLGSNPCAYDGEGQAFVDPEIIAAFEAAEYVPIIAFFADHPHEGKAASNVNGMLGSAESVVNSLQERARASSAGTTESLNKEMEEGNLKDYRSLWIVNAFAAHVNKTGLERLAKLPQIEKIRLDHQLSISPGVAAVPGVKETAGTVRSAASHTDSPWNLELINAPAVWQEGITGKNVVVAVMDTGVDPFHPALQEKYRGNLPGHSDKTSWFDVTGSNTEVLPARPRDPYGHGTHVAGIILGGSPGEPLGVAPGAQWIGVNIFEDGTTWDSHITQAFQWLLAPGGDPANAPQIINCSWASRPEYVKDYLQWEILHNLEQAGIFVVFAAGNNGFEGPGSPASYPHAFCAGALKKEGETISIAPFSSRGPVNWEGMSYVKPEIVAPGMDIRSAWLNGGYTFLDGTSTATAHVSGSAALLLEARPGISPSEIGYTFKQTANWHSSWNALGERPNGTYGYGLLDAAAAIRLETPLTPELLFHDRADEGIMNWGTSSHNPWKITRERVYDGEFAFADSPRDHYPNNSSSWLALNEPISLCGYYDPVLSFQHYYDLPLGEKREDDHATVELSTDGRNWVRLYRFFGNSGEYVESTFPLKLPAEANQVFLRFHLQSNGNGPGVGWYIDDIKVSARPRPLSELEGLKIISERNIVGIGEEINVKAEAFFCDTVSRFVDPSLVEWHSSESTVARVENGKITAITAGEVEIRGQFAGREAQFVLEVIEVPSPLAVPSPGTYINEVTVSLEGEVPGLKFYYTLDGSEPDQYSPLYEAPLSITETTVLKTRAYLEDFPGATLTLPYTIEVGGTVSGSLQLQHRSFSKVNLEASIICRTEGTIYPVTPIDGEGKFSIKLPLGSYKLVAQQPQYLTAVTTFDLIEESHFTLSPLLLYLGDINNDGRIDLNDLALLSLAYGTSPGDEHWDPRADLNRNGRVDAADLNILTRNYGKNTPGIP